MHSSSEHDDELSQLEGQVFLEEGGPQLRAWLVLRNISHTPCPKQQAMMAASNDDSRRGGWAMESECLNQTGENILENMSVSGMPFIGSRASVSA